MQSSKSSTFKSNAQTLDENIQVCGYEAGMDIIESMYLETPGIFSIDDLKQMFQYIAARDGGHDLSYEVAQNLYQINELFGGLQNQRREVSPVHSWTGNQEMTNVCALDFEHGALYVAATALAETSHAGMHNPFEDLCKNDEGNLALESDITDEVITLLARLRSGRQ